MKIIVPAIPINLVTNLLLSLCVFLRRNQKQEFNFQLVGGLVMRNIYVF